MAYTKGVRVKALELLKMGESARNVNKILGVSRHSVMRWAKMVGMTFKINDYHGGITGVEQSTFTTHRPLSADSLFVMLVVSHYARFTVKAGIMSIAPGYTNQEILDLVHDYDLQPHGTKLDWLEKQGITRDKFRRWRDTVFDGVLQRGLIPRDDSVMTSTNKRRIISKLYEQKEYEKENDKLRDRIQELETVNEALGKAIGLLHQLNEQEPDTSQTTDQKSS